MNTVWHCFEDPDYFNMWCVTPRTSTSNDTKRFYLPQEEAEKLTQLLNSYHHALVNTGSSYGRTVAEKLVR